MKRSKKLKRKLTFEMIQKAVAKAQIGETKTKFWKALIVFPNALGVTREAIQKTQKKARN